MGVLFTINPEFMSIIPHSKGNDKDKDKDEDEEDHDLTMNTYTKLRVKLGHELYQYIIYQILQLYIQLITQPKTSAEIFTSHQSDITDDNGIDETTHQFDEGVTGNILTDTHQFETDSRMQGYRNQAMKQVSTLIWTMVGNFKTRAQANAKEPVTMTYADIMREIDFSKDREKQKIKGHFKQMSAEERRVEMEMKKLKIGAFAIDRSKLNKYGAGGQLLVGEIDEEVINGATDEPIGDNSGIDFGDDDDEKDEEDTSMMVRDIDNDVMGYESEEDDFADMVENGGDGETDFD
jgi:hypothetical protein